MEINNLFGLPAHPLLVHAPIVLVPLCFIAAILMAVKAEWRQRFGIPTAVLAVIAAVMVQLAIGSGEELEQRVRESDLIEKHSQLAENARPFVFLFALALVGIAVWDVLQRRRAAQAGSEVEAAGATAGTRSSKLVSVAMVVTVLLGAASTYMVVQTGHSGAKATWHNTPAKRAGGEGGEREGGERGEDRD